QRDFEAANEAGGQEVKPGIAVKLVADAAFDKDGAEALMKRPAGGRTVGLLPAHLEPWAAGAGGILKRMPVDPHLSGEAGKGAVLDGVGEQFMENHAQNHGLIGLQINRFA